MSVIIDCRAKLINAFDLRRPPAPWHMLARGNGPMELTGDAVQGIEAPAVHPTGILPGSWGHFPIHGDIFDTEEAAR